MITTSPEIDVIHDIIKLADQGLQALVNNEPNKFNEISSYIQICSNHSFADLKHTLHEKISDLSWNLQDSSYNSDQYLSSVNEWHKDTVNACKNAI